MPLMVLIGHHRLPHTATLDSPPLPLLHLPAPHWFCLHLCHTLPACCTATACLCSAACHLDCTYLPAPPPPHHLLCLLTCLPACLPPPRTACLLPPAPRFCYFLPAWVCLPPPPPACLLPPACLPATLRGRFSCHRGSAWTFAAACRLPLALLPGTLRESSAWVLPACLPACACCACTCCGSAPHLHHACSAFCHLPACSTCLPLGFSPAACYYCTACLPAYLLYHLRHYIHLLLPAASACLLLPAAASICATCLIYTHIYVWWLFSACLLRFWFLPLPAAATISPAPNV